MLSLLEAKSDIAESQRKLEATMAREFVERAKKNIGYPAGTTRNANVFTDGKLWYWSADLRQPDIPNPRRLNWFGLFTPERDLQITVEINVAYSGRNDQVAGFFAHDSDTGGVYLLHSGRVGGGTTGVGKSAFLAWSDHRLTEAIDSDGEPRLGVIVMPVEGPGAVHALSRYVDQIAQFKIAVRAGELDSDAFKEKQKAFDDFYAEGRGRRQGRRSAVIDYLSRHGEVVDALYRWRQLQGFPNGGRLVKNVLIDLGLESAGGLVEVYEVKTSAARPDLYAGIGQLLVHGSDSRCQRSLVLPSAEALPEDVALALERVGIRLLKFKLSESEASILSGGGDRDA